MRTLICLVFVVGVDAKSNATLGVECPVCNCTSPNIWPASGCDVGCGAKCGDTCCTIEPKPCPICSCSSPKKWPFANCDAKCGARCDDTCCCIEGVGNCGSSRVKKPLKKYVINLDLEPEVRFAEIAKDHKTYYGVLAQALKLMFNDNETKEFFSAIVLPNETKRELQGLADALGVSLDTVFLGEFFYELTVLHEIKGIGMAACSGIIAQSSDGTVYHGRNQDYPPPFSPMQYHATFMKNGKAIFEATNFAGIVSIGGTCMVPGGFSVEVNAREHVVKLDKENFMKDAAAGLPSINVLVRQVCTQGGDFESAVKFLAETPALGVSNYYIVAGAKPGEGAVITRNASGADTDIQRLSQGYPTGAPWYLLQTNWDRWDNTTHQAPILPAIYGADLRRESGMQLMAQRSPDSFSLADMWAVMSDDGTSTGVKWGLYNTATIHTELMIPATGEYHSYAGHEVVMMDAIV